MKSKLLKLRLGILFPFLFLFVFFSCKKDEVTPPTGPAVDLSISSVVDNISPAVDGFVTYTISAKNLGPNNAREVVVVDSLPDGLIVESTTPGKGSYSVQTGKWLIGDLSKDALAVLTIKAKVISYGNITNKVRITGKVTDSNAKNDSSKTTVATSLAGLSKEQACTYDMFSAMKDIYLWDDALPSVLDPRKYNTAENALGYLSGLKINPETGKPIDHYSFLDKIGNLSGEIGGGTASGDYGFMVTAGYNSSNRVSFFVTYAYKNSPAGQAGVARSYEVVKINGSDAVHPDVDAQGYLIGTSPGYTNMVNSLFNSATASFTFKKPDGTTLDASLNVASYSINSVLYDAVLDVGSKKVGYVVFNQFLGASSQTELSNSIAKFETSGVQYLIVDLRYNGGGSVETCEKFCNLLAPPSANGKLMYSYKMNPELMQYYTSNNYSLSSKFTKNNSFQPIKIYFIVSGGTASASELLINNLRPYYSGNLFLVGQTTYGKPCGFWATPIGYTDTQTTPKEGYDLYAVSFESVNANNEGGYYAGMTPGATKYPGIKAYDSYNLPWGDVNDASLAQAINHISSGAFKAQTQSKVKSVNVTPISNIDRQFKGMIDFRKQLKQKTR
jgi:carboxyl-terminal processing protease